jgi:hypothetical protein
MATGGNSDESLAATQHGANTNFAARVAGNTEPVTES